MLCRFWEYSRKCQLFIVAVVTLVTLYLLLNVQNYSKYTGNRPFTDVSKCYNLSDANLSHLLNLTYEVHRILEEHGIEHWLCYGSIFGVLRKGGPLPWDDDVDIGILGDGKLSEMDFSKFISAFENAGLTVKNWWRRSGLLQISAGHQFLKVDLMVFYKWGHWMKRSGYESWIGFFNYNKYHTFPAALIQQPLPKERFGTSELPVPRGGIEIQKYLYPNDWWRVIPPTQCSAYK